MLPSTFTQRSHRLRAGCVLVCALIGLASCAVNDDTGARSNRPIVTVFGTLSDSEADAFTASVQPFERSSGINVRYVGSSNFEADLLERLRRGDAPDIALLPQPGLLPTLVSEGFALPWTEALEASATEQIDPRLVGLSTVENQVYASWYELTLKSLVWYSPSEFARLGLTVPQTWSDLDALVAKVVAAGVSPWCLGIRDGGATGWVATDWVEDLVLRFAGPDVYDRWITHEVPFSDRSIANAVQRFGDIALSNTLVYGGSRAAVRNTVTDAARQLTSSPSKCVLNRQASFLPRLVGSRTAVGPAADLWAFPLPSAEGAKAPLIVGGTMSVRFSADPNVDQLATYLASAEAARERAKLGSFVSPLTTVPLDAYSSELDRSVAGWLRDADVLRFDASDLMPPSVGVAAFWSGMAAWLGGARLSAVLNEIDRAWPATSNSIPGQVTVKS